MLFKAGDVVQLKSGGRRMAVEAASNGQVMCAWYADDDELRTETFREHDLKGFDPKGEPDMYAPEIDPFE